MNKSMTQPQIFWAPALDTARKIDDSDVVTAIEAHYGAEASKLCAAFVAEVAQLYQGEAAE